MAVDIALAKSFFLNASDIVDPLALAAYLDEVCGDNTEIRARVEALLRADDESPLAPPSEGTLDSSDESRAHDESTEFRPNLEAGLVVSNRYILQERIGEGGMGEVWVADQTDPVKRKVALKLIKTGMDSRAVLQRFEMERQALAMMEHPNIAKVLEAGLTPGGQPFFAMELVNGLPLNTFCDELKLSPRERLTLFVLMCQAVQHAHQKGIVHRDLKPANILVTMIDGKPVPKVIDFGVAKATAGKLTDESIFTHFGAMVGTLEYMSPEQATLAGDDIDTRSDIYSLGVILYEMLTGLRPIDAKQRQEATFTEMIRLIREEEPSRPSTRLSADDSLASQAEKRQIEPRRLITMLRGELDWVIMKCLEKQRHRRYETANDLARDVQRYLAGEEVEARPPSKRYRVRKFVSRNKAQVVAASLVVLALLLGIAGTSLGLIQARRHEDRAIKAQLAEAEQRIHVEYEKKKAEAEKQIAQAVKDFLQNKLLAQTDTTTQADALVDAGRASSGAKLNPTIRELLDRAATQLTPEKIEQSFSNQPRVQAEILATVGNTYRSIGEYPPAIDFLKRAESLRRQHLGSEHADTLASMSDLAWAYLDASNFDLALPLFAQTLALRKATLGPEDPKTLTNMNDLASAYQAAGKFDLAIPLLEETLKLQKSTLGPKHPNTLLSMNNLAVGYQNAGKFDLALPLFEQTLTLRKAVLGPEHPGTLLSMHNLAAADRVAGKLKLALPLFEEAFKLQQAKLGPEHPNTLITRNNLAEAYVGAGKLDLALPLMEETLKLTKVRLGPDHPRTLHGMNNLAGAYWTLKQLDKSVPLFEAVVPLMEKKLGRDHQDTLIAVANLGVNYKDAGQVAKGIPLLEEAHRASQKHPVLRWVGLQLADAYAKAGKNDERIKLLRELLADARKSLPNDHPQLAEVLTMTGRSLLQTKAYVEAEPLFRESLAIREKTQPELWTTFDAKSLLGAALLGQKKYADAEPLLLAGYQGMSTREQSIPPAFTVLITEANEWLEQLRKATGNKVKQGFRAPSNACNTYKRGDS